MRHTGTAGWTRRTVIACAGAAAAFAMACMGASFASHDAPGAGFSIGAPVGAQAQVLTTEEPTAGSAVYIAGNPDLYPIEYYDEATGSYRGLLPAVYERASEELGVDFAYVSAGAQNQQRRLADNCQVEIVSACSAGSLDGLQSEVELLTYLNNGTEDAVCIGFTAIAPAVLVEVVSRAVGDEYARLMLQDVVSQVAQDGRTDGGLPAVPFAVLAGVQTAVVAALALALGRTRRRMQVKRQDEKTDPLTGIGNAAYFSYWFERQVEGMMRGLYYVAYIGVDIDWVEKYVGVERSEWLQRHAAEVLSAAAADSDVVARVANGRFALAFMSPDNERAMQRMVELLERLNDYEPLRADEDKRAFRAGLVGLDGNDASCERALLEADQGYRLAESRQEACCFSDAAALSKAAFQSRVMRGLTDAVRNGEMLLYLQFVVRASDGVAVSAEALTRWQNPVEGILSPAHFIDEMKAAGIADRLDYYMLEQACSRLAAWQADGSDAAGLGGLAISCNVSRSTIASEDFAERLAAIVDRYEFDHSRLVIELTEEALYGDIERARTNALACKKAGHRIALDDMGSGATSLGDLCDYPIDIIKVDRSLVTRITTDRGASLIRGVCEFAHALGIKVLCEGVETAEVDALVRAAGCDFIQGYYYSRAYPEADAIELYTALGGRLRPAGER